MAKRGFFMYWFTPLGRMRDAAGSLEQAIKSSKDSLKTLGPRARVEPEEGDARRIADASERFEAMYLMNKWTQREIEQQKKALKAGKVTSLAAAAFVFVVSLGVVAMGSPLIQFFAVPLGMLITILALVKAFRYELFATQLDLRALIDVRAFLAMPDFWRRMIS